MIKQIKPGSLSHKFLKLLYDDWDLECGVNVCGVFWRSLLGLVFGVGLLCFSAFVAYIVYSILIFVVSFFYLPSWVTGDEIMVGYVWCWLILAFCFAYSLLEHEVSIPTYPTWWKKTDKLALDTRPSLLSVWYTSVKEKTCVKIVVKSDNQ